MCRNDCGECLSYCVQINDCSSCNRVCTEPTSCPQKSCTTQEHETCADYDWNFGELTFSEVVYDACRALHGPTQQAKDLCFFYAHVEKPEIAVPAYKCFAEAGDDLDVSGCEPTDRISNLRSVDHCGLLVEPDTEDNRAALELLNWIEDGLLEGAATCLAIDDCEVAHSCFLAWSNHLFAKHPQD